MLQVLLGMLSLRLAANTVVGSSESKGGLSGGACALLTDIHDQLAGWLRAAKEAVDWHDALLDTICASS